MVGAVAEGDGTQGEAVVRKLSDLPMGGGASSPAGTEE